MTEHRSEAEDGIYIGPIEHSPSFCGQPCKCWCAGCEQHNAREAEAEVEKRVTALRQLDPSSDPDDYWTGWNDALDRVLAVLAKRAHR